MLFELLWQAFFLQPPSRLNLLGRISTSETACLMRLHVLGSPHEVQKVKEPGK